MKRLTTLFVLLATLPGCLATTPSVPNVAKVIVSVPCIDKMPDRPYFVTDADLATLDGRQTVIALRQDQLAARGYIAITDALMLSCLR